MLPENFTIIPPEAKALCPGNPGILEVYTTISDHANHSYTIAELEEAPERYKSLGTVYFTAETAVFGDAEYTLARNQAVISAGNIAEYLKMDKKTVLRYIDLLEEAGAIITERLKTGTRFTVTIHATEPVKEEARKNREQIRENKKQIDEAKKQGRPNHTRIEDGVSGYRLIGKATRTTSTEPPNGTTENPLFYAVHSDFPDHQAEPPHRVHFQDKIIDQGIVSQGSVDNSLDPLEVIHTEEAGAELSTSDRATTEAEQPQGTGLTAEEETMLREETKTLTQLEKMTVRSKVNKAKRAKLEVNRELIRKFAEQQKQRRR